MHDLLVGQGWVSPGEFWRLPPGQVWWIIEAKTPPSVKTRGEDMAELRAMVKAEKAKEAAQRV